MFQYTQRFSDPDTVDIIRYDPTNRLLQLQDEAGDITLYEGVTEDVYVKLVQSNKDTDDYLEHVRETYDQVVSKELGTTDDALQVEQTSFGINPI